jgi:hypothetical protein
LQHAEIAEPVGRHVVGVQHFRAPEKISLEVNESLLTGGEEVPLGFDFLCQHPATPWTVALDQCCTLFRSGELHFDLDDVGDLDERVTGIIGHKIVERDHVPRFFQILAGKHDLGVGRDTLQYLDDRDVRRQQVN